MAAAPLALSCTPYTAQPSPPVAAISPEMVSAFEIEEIISEPCTADETEDQGMEPEMDDVRGLLRSAWCRIELVKAEANASERLRQAEFGLSLARQAISLLPENPLPHYLAAILTGLVAENDPARGLSLVPDIESEAAKAVELEPGIDNAGPHRLLGELYLQAPGFPISIGDKELAVEHFREAVRIAPTHYENRLDLIDALTRNEQTVEACRELATLLGDFNLEGDPGHAYKKAVTLLKNICAEMEK